MCRLNQDAKLAQAGFPPKQSCFRASWLSAQCVAFLRTASWRRRVFLFLRHKVEPASNTRAFLFRTSVLNLVSLTRCLKRTFPTVAPLACRFGSRLPAQAFALPKPLWPQKKRRRNCTGACSESSSFKDTSLSSILRTQSVFSAQKEQDVITRLLSCLFSAMTDSIL
jgi:hypothetical protein